MKPFLYVFTALATALLAGCKLYYETPAIQHTPVRHASPEEGKRLATMICGPCHYNADEKNFSGKKMDTPGILGTIYAANITQDNAHGIGDYSDAELVYLIRTGVSKDGKLMPYMQRPNLADEDLDAIIAFLRSDDPLVRPSAHVPGKTSYSPVGRLGVSMSKPIPYKGKVVSRPTEGKLLGKYMVDNLACYHCHSKSFASLDFVEPEQSKGFMGGGTKLKDAQNRKVKAPNLTPHDTGILQWSEAEFKRALTEGIGKDNSIIAYPMPSFAQLNDAEISAIYTYLRSLKPIDNPVSR